MSGPRSNDAWAGCNCDRCAADRGAVARALSTDRPTQAAFDEMPLWKRLIWMSMTGKERRAFKRYAVMRGGDPVVALDHWIKKHSADGTIPEAPKGTAE